MPTYKCDRCLKEFDQKCHYENHINKKFPCKEKPQNPSNTSQNPSKIENISTMCNYCGREFSRKDNLHRHITGYCKVKKTNDATMEEIMTMLIKLKESDEKKTKEIEKLKGEITKYQTIINNTQNNINKQNNITFNIKAYGTEDTSRITVQEYKKILCRGMNSVPVFIEKLHFNKNVPENHNVYISNLRDEYVLMYDGKIWRLKDRVDALQQLYEDGSGILETKFEELLDLLDEPTIKMFKRFLKIKDDDDEKIRSIKKELKKVLYENRKMVMKTRNTGDNLLLEE